MCFGMSTLKLMWCFRGGVSPAVAEATGAVALQFAGVDRESAIVRLATAEREQGGSAAKSIQRMSARLAAQCREKPEKAWSVNKQTRAGAHYFNHQHRIISYRREPSPSPEPEQLHAKFCNTALQSTAFPVSQAWNETDSRATPRRFSLPAQRRHNDLKSQTMNKSQPRRLRHARRISCLFQSRIQRDGSRIFFRGIDDRRNGGRTNFIGRYGFDWFDWFLARRPELRLLHASRQ